MWFFGSMVLRQAMTEEPAALWPSEKVHTLLSEAESEWRWRSWGSITISFWRNVRWFRSCDTHSSNLSRDFSYQNDIYKKRIKATLCVCYKYVWCQSNGFIICLYACGYLQVVNAIPCIQINTHGLFLDGHDGETNVNASTEFPLLQLNTNTDRQKMSSKYGCGPSLKNVHLIDP